MKSNSTFEAGQFPTTIWADIARAGETQNSQSLALSGLLHRYRPPLLAYLRNTNRVPKQDIEDLVHSFIADKVIQGRLLSYANQDKGRFRNYLITCLKNYISSFYRNTKNANLASPALSLDTAQSTASSDHVIDPTMAFDITWAQQVVAEALASFKTECHVNDRKTMWELFNRRILSPAFNDEADPSYQELVTLGVIENEQQGRNLVITAKRAFKRHLYHVVMEYVGETDAPHEIKGLKEVLAQYIHIA